MWVSRAVAAIALAAVAVAPATGRSPFTPNRHTDGADVTPSPLDVTQVSLDQEGARLVLRITTAGSWRANQLSPARGRTLCVVLARPGAAPSRICVLARAHGTGLRFTRLLPDGHVDSVRPLAARVTRPDAHTLEADFSPQDVELSLGPYAWRAESTWQDADSCRPPAACHDVAPDTGTVDATIAPLVEPRCFGAAARDPSTACVNTALAGSVYPEPADAPLQTNSPCALVAQSTVLFVCAFGARPSSAKETFALVGDSHAAHLRAALDVVALAEGWRGISMTHTSCPLTAASVLDVEPSLRTRCRRWNRDVRRWLDRHRSVHTVILAANAHGHVADRRGIGNYAARVRGFASAIRALPASVRHVIVVRDVPATRNSTLACVQRGLSAHRHDLATRCSVPLHEALLPDPDASAARRSRSRRVHAIDLTRFMCGRQRCYAVVGNTLVHKDSNHLTPAFATTLGPYLLRAMRGILGARPG
jgi:hypothetical protein